MKKSITVQAAFLFLLLSTFSLGAASAQVPSWIDKPPLKDPKPVLTVDPITPASSPCSKPNQIFNQESGACECARCYGPDPDDSSECVEISDCDATAFPREEKPRFAPPQLQPVPPTATVTPLCPPCHRLATDACECVEIPNCTEVRGPGGVDPAFGDQGEVVTRVGGEGDHGTAYAVTVQNDGKIVVAGTVEHALSTTGLNTDIVVIRYNPDGSLDPGFGSSGKVISDLGGRDVADAVALQSDGKILVAGHTADASSNSRVVLIRLNANGSYDWSFGDWTTRGERGVVVATLGARASAHALYVEETSGRRTISLIGERDGDFLIFLYGDDGRPMRSGTTIAGADVWACRVSSVTDIGGGGDTAYAFATHPYSHFHHPYGILTSGYATTDSMIVAVGSGESRYRDHGSHTDFAVARFFDGACLDNYERAPDGGGYAFGDGGRASTDFGFSRNDVARAVAIQADGKIVAAGYSATPVGEWERPRSDFAVVRYLEDGGLDTSFGGGDGKATFRVGEENQARFTAVESDGKILVAGYTSLEARGGGDRSQFVLARLNPDGSPENFGREGPVLSNSGKAFAGTLSRDGSSLYLVGRSNDGYLTLERRLLR
jgi:uncharacterized delta-60 repeat protein